MSSTRRSVKRTYSEPDDEDSAEHLTDSDTDPTWGPAGEKPSEEEFYIPPPKKRGRKPKIMKTEASVKKEVPEKQDSSSKQKNSSKTPTPTTTTPSPAKKTPSPAQKIPEKVASSSVKVGASSAAGKKQNATEEGESSRFKRGDFVVKIKELPLSKSVPIWKMDSGSLLQRYDAVPDNKTSRHLYQSCLTFSSCLDTSVFTLLETKVTNRNRNVITVEVLEVHEEVPEISSTTQENTDATVKSQKTKVVSPPKSGSSALHGVKKPQENTDATVKDQKTKVVSQPKSGSSATLGVNKTASSGTNSNRSSKSTDSSSTKCISILKDSSQNFTDDKSSDSSNNAVAEVESCTSSVPDSPKEISSPHSGSCGGRIFSASSSSSSSSSATAAAAKTKVVSPKKVSKSKDEKPHTNKGRSGSEPNTNEGMSGSETSNSTESSEEESQVGTFHIYIQILLSQALEPEFMTALKTSDEEGSYYLKPLEAVDQMIEEKKNTIELSIGSRFMSSLKKRPNIRIINPKGMQYTQGMADSMVKSIQLYGDPYHEDTLTKIDTEEDTNMEEFMIVGEPAADRVRKYHELHHYKHSLYLSCINKVEMQKKEGVCGLDSLEQILLEKDWLKDEYQKFQKMF